MDYTTLITSQHRKGPKFMDMVATLTSAIQQNIDFHGHLPQDFDLDLAVGAQLDIIGLWVGASRRVDVPLNNWFSFDVPGKGFDEGIWRGPFDPPSGLVDLDDVTFRRLLRAVIAANHWDGTYWNYHSVLQKAMPPGNVIKANENWDMTITIVVNGPKLSPLMTALLTTGRLSQIKPAGVAISNYVLPT